MNGRIHAVSAVLAAGGLGVSAYLTYLKLQFGSGISCGIGDCDLVNSSSYSEIFGIPVALIGMAGYSLLLILHTAAYSADADGLYRPLLSFVFFSALAGTLFSAYLTYVELFVLRAICPWCVVSALIITALLILSALALRSPRARPSSGSQPAQDIGPTA